VFGQIRESVPSVFRDFAGGISASIRASIRWWRSEETQDALRYAIVDFVESWDRVVRKAKKPTREGVMRFMGNQVLINTVAWTAGVTAAGLVKNFFEVRSFRNLWGLTAPGSRSLVSADDYELIVNVASYSAGLIMLIMARYLILRLIAEFHALRRERASLIGPRNGARPGAQQNYGEYADRARPHQ
jgi:hypothetical protein